MRIGISNVKTKDLEKLAGIFTKDFFIEVRPGQTSHVEVHAVFQ